MTFAVDSPAATINRARFAGRDFYTFVDDLVARIQALFLTEFNDFVSSGTGQMLIDIVAWAGDTLAFYIDRQASESYLETARTRKAVARLSRQNGYKMRASIAASVDLSVLLRETHAFAVGVPIGFQFEGPNDLVFESIELVTFLAGEGPLSAPRIIACREGVTRTEIFSSDGTMNQVFRLSPGDQKFVARGTVVGTVGGVPWVESATISFDASDQFEVGYNDDPTTVRFGDGVAGNVPPIGAEIKFVYRATSGAGGLAARGNTITDVVVPLVVAFTDIGLTITNPAPASGGAPPESLEETKAKAPKFYKTREVAVTREDYESLAITYSDPLAGQVSVAQAFVARGAAEDLELQILLNNVRTITVPLAASVTALTTDADAASDAIAVAVTAGTGALASQAAALTTLGTSLVSARTGVQSLKNRATQIGVDATDIQAYVVSGKTETDASGATAPQKAAIKGWFDLINAEALAIDAQAGNIDADADTALTQVAAGETAAADAETSRVVANTSLTSVSPLVIDLNTAISGITTAMVSGFRDAIETQLASIFSHVDLFLAADCQANLIVVPTLTRDVDGFLTAPPIALLRSLQDYLDDRNEVTQVPEVVSGELFLVLVDIDGTIGVRDGFVKATVVGNVRKAIDDLLKSREFGVSLYLSDLYRVVVPDASGRGGVEGVKWATLRITGPIAYLDSDGNIIIDHRRVVSRGTVTLDSESAGP